MTAAPCSITGMTETPGEISAAVSVDPSAGVFAGHFPGNPVLPGACSIQTLTEILRSVFGSGLSVTGIVSCKFLRAVNPETHRSLSFSVSYSDECGRIRFSVCGMLPDGEPYMKIKGVAVC